MEGSAPFIRNWASSRSRLGFGGGPGRNPSHNSDPPAPSY